MLLSPSNYCNSLYCGISKPQIARLQLVQTAAARFLFNSCKSTHIPPILGSAHWLPINLRTDFKSLCNQTSIYLSELLQPYTPFRSLRSSNKYLLFVTHSRFKHRGDWAFSVVPWPIIKVGSF